MFYRLLKTEAKKTSKNIY